MATNLAVSDKGASASAIRGGLEIHKGRRFAMRPNVAAGSVVHDVTRHGSEAVGSRVDLAKATSVT